LLFAGDHPSGRVEEVGTYVRHEHRHDYAYFERALRTRNFAAARAYAHGSRLQLPDGLALLLLSLDEPSSTRDWYGRAAARWHARLVIELRGIDVSASQLALAAVAALPAGGPVDAARALAGVCEAHDHGELAQVLKEWADRRDLS
jgi:hypothetical protein